MCWLWVLHDAGVVVFDCWTLGCLLSLVCLLGCSLLGECLFFLCLFVVSLFVGCFLCVGVCLF